MSGFESAGTAVLLLVSLPLQKLPLLVLAHLLAALLDDTTHLRILPALRRTAERAHV